jgi:hypothetical protein
MAPDAEQALVEVPGRPGLGGLAVVVRDVEEMVSVPAPRTIALSSAASSPGRPWRRTKSSIGSDTSPITPPSRLARGRLPPMSRLLALGLSLVFLTACFEGFGALETTVQLDTEAQVFRVERRVLGVSSAFLGCGDTAGCAEVVGRLRAFAPLPTGGPAERLMQRLLDSGAKELSMEIVVGDGRVDAVLQYVAPLGSTAADDTWIHAEWEGRHQRGDYLLTIDAQPSITPPDKYRTRRVARAGPAGPEWGESWVLPARTLAATTHMTVQPGAPNLLAEFPDLLPALSGGAAPAPVPDPAPVVAVVDPPPAPAPAPRPGPRPRAGPGPRPRSSPHPPAGPPPPVAPAPVAPAVVAAAPAPAPAPPPAPRRPGPRSRPGSGRAHLGAPPTPPPPPGPTRSTWS